MFELATETVLLLAAAAFVAGFIDSIAGGGSLMTIPALLLAGVPPLATLGTNKLQGLFGVASATISYAQQGHADIRRQLPSALLAFVGGLCGALLATLLPIDFLRLLMPFLLIAIAVYFALKPNMDDVDRAERITPFVFGVTAVPLIALYDGLFGPGTGSFYMLAFVALGGLGILRATANTKLLNLASNLGGFLAFALVGAVWWKIGLVMGASQFIGARIGAALAMRNGAKLIKPLLVLVCVAMAIRLLAAPDNPVRALLGF